MENNEDFITTLLSFPICRGTVMGGRANNWRNAILRMALHFFA